MKPNLTSPQATIIAAVIVLTGTLVGHLLTYMTKERDRKVAK